MDRTRPDSPLTAVCLVGACLMVARGIQISHAYDRAAFQSILVGFGLALLPLFVPRRPVAERWVLRALAALFAVGFVWQFSLLNTARPGMYLRASGEDIADFHLWLAVAVVAGGVAFAGSRQVWTLGTAGLVAAFMALGLWMVRVSPQPFIDVWHIHQQSAGALTHGFNPYELTFPNIYGQVTWFSPGTATPQRLLFGYVYLPWTLLLATAGYLVGGDYRLAFVVATGVSGALIALAGRNRWAAAAATLFLFTPRAFFVVEQGWTEPSVLLPLAAAVFFAARKQLWPLAISLGVLGVAKQYSVLALPAVLLFRPLYPSWREFGRAILKMVLVGGLVTLPLALWNWGAFWHDVYGMQFSAPFRTDSLSLPVWWLDRFGAPMPGFLQLVIPFALGGLVLWRAPRTPAGFAWAVGTIYFVFFIFRQGFTNYFFLVIAAYCLAIGASEALAKAADEKGASANAT